MLFESNIWDLEKCNVLKIISTEMDIFIRIPNYVPQYIYLHTYNVTHAY